MNKPFTYSILQYKHSFILHEALNVGIVFFFYEERKIKFIFDKFNRPKNLYQNYDFFIVSETLKYIDSKLKKIQLGLFDDIISNEGVKNFIAANIIPDDATSLQFTEPINALSTTNNISHTVKYYSELLLPSVTEKRTEINKKNETYILKKFTTILFGKDKGLTNGISRDIPIRANKIDLNFEIVWQNTTTNYVKPISFDLIAKNDIQDKKVRFYGYLSLLKEHASKNNINFHLLLAAPTDEKLHGEYDDAKDTLINSKAPVRIVEENQLGDYADYAAREIRKHIDMLLI